MSSIEIGQYFAFDSTGLAGFDGSIGIGVTKLSSSSYEYTEFHIKTRHVYARHVLEIQCGMDINSLIRAFASLDAVITARRKCIGEQNELETGIVIDTNDYVVRLLYSTNVHKNYVYVTKNGIDIFTFTTDMGKLDSNTIGDILAAPQWKQEITSFGNVCTLTSNERRIDVIWVDGGISMFGVTKKLCTVDDKSMFITQVYASNKDKPLYSTYYTAPIKPCVIDPPAVKRIKPCYNGKSEKLCVTSVTNVVSSKCPSTCPCLRFKKTASSVPKTERCNPCVDDSVNIN